MSSLGSAPPPLHIIRSHSSAISALFISCDNERIYSGDISGSVVITSTRSLRPLASWKAHTDGLLGVEEWGKQVITHGRDNKLHVWKLPSQTPSTVGGSASAAPDTLALELSHSLDVNALNFCRFSLLPLGGVPPTTTTTDLPALVAVPNLVDSSLADIWALLSMERIHAAIGKGTLDTSTTLRSDGRGTKNPTGIIMSMHLLPAHRGGTMGMVDKALSLIAAYENGSVKLWRYRNVEKERSIEGVGWECLWSSKLHVESVMATAISLDRSLGLSVSADHLVGRYDLNADPVPSLESAGTVYRTKHPGNGAVVFHDDGRVCAIGGWDGRVRLFSTKSFKALGTLIYHKAAVQTLAFAHARPVAGHHHRHQHQQQDDHHHHSHGNAGGGKEGGSRGAGILADTKGVTSSSCHNEQASAHGDEDDDNDEEDYNEAEKEEDDDDEDEEDMDAEEKARRSRWLVSGGKDGRVAVWELADLTARGKDRDRD